MPAPLPSLSSRFSCSCLALPLPFLCPHPLRYVASISHVARRPSPPRIFHSIELVTIDTRARTHTHIRDQAAHKQNKNTRFLYNHGQFLISYNRIRSLESRARSILHELEFEFKGGCTQLVEFRMMNSNLWICIWFKNAGRRNGNCSFPRARARVCDVELEMHLQMVAI